MKKKLNIKNKAIKLFIICFIIGFILSFLFYFSLTKEELKSLLFAVKNNKVLFKVSNNTINHLKILSVITLLSFFYIGIPLYVGLMISEGFKLFLRIIIMYKIYKIYGILYVIFYTLITNGIYIVLLLFIFKKLLKIFKITYKNKISKENINYSVLYSNLISAISLILLVFISDLLIYLYGNNILLFLKSFCKI